MLSANIKCCGYHKIIIITGRAQGKGRTGLGNGAASPSPKPERPQGLVDTAGEERFYPRLINHFCTGAPRQGHPRGTGLALTGQGECKRGGGPGLRLRIQGSSEQTGVHGRRLPRPGGPTSRGLSSPDVLLRVAAFLMEVNVSSLGW